MSDELLRLAEAVAYATPGTTTRADATDRLRDYLQRYPRQPQPAQPDAATALAMLAAEHAKLRRVSLEVMEERDAARAALVEIRGLALPYAQGDTREAWRAREMCRLVDEATGTTSPDALPDGQCLHDSNYTCETCTWDAAYARGMADGRAQAAEAAADAYGNGHKAGLADAAAKFNEGFVAGHEIGMADAAEAIAAWMEQECHQHAYVDDIRSGEWRKHLKKGT